MLQTERISVCICTYKRPQLLTGLLEKLSRQLTLGLFTYSIVVCDNDALQSAESAVSVFAAKSSIPTLYCVESRQNIALARNKAVANATGNYIAFIDDDELPGQDWLLTLFKAIHEYNVDGVLGPVKPQFEKIPPQWVVKSHLCERPSYSTGFVIDWPKGRTGNVLLKRELFANAAQPFNPEFRTGEDQDFFRRSIESGRVFIWCDEAVAYELVPPIRWKRTFMIRRAFLRGASARLHPTLNAASIAKSVVAVILYAASLPFGMLLGHHRFMLFLLKLCDHLGKLLALIGINPIQQQYITD